MDGEVVLPQPPEGLLDGQGVLRRGVGVPPPLEDMDGQVQTGQGLPVGGKPPVAPEPVGGEGDWVVFPKPLVVPRLDGPEDLRPAPGIHRLQVRRGDPAVPVQVQPGEGRLQGLPHRSRPRLKLLPGDAPISVGVKILAEHGVQPQPPLLPVQGLLHGPVGVARQQQSGQGYRSPCSHSRSDHGPLAPPQQQELRPSTAGVGLKEGGPVLQVGHTGLRGVGAVDCPVHSAVEWTLIPIGAPAGAVTEEAQSPAGKLLPKEAAEAVRGPVSPVPEGVAGLGAGAVDLDHQPGDDAIPGQIQLSLQLLPVPGPEPHVLCDNVWFHGLRLLSVRRIADPWLTRKGVGAVRPFSAGKRHRKAGRTA